MNVKSMLNVKFILEILSQHKYYLKLSREKATQIMDCLSMSKGKLMKKLIHILVNTSN